MHLFILRLQNRISPIRILRKRKIRKLNNIKLHFGCGTKIIEGWFNIDGWKGDKSRLPDFLMDLRCPLPFSNVSTNFIFAEHTMEHFDFKEGMKIYTEFYRILKKGGVLRIVVPDLEKYCLNYINKNVEWFKIVEPEVSIPALVINKMMYNNFHKVFYDFDTLQEMLRKAGFRKIIRSSLKSSKYPEFYDCQTDNKRHETLSLYVEAIK